METVNLVDNDNDGIKENNSKMGESANNFASNNRIGIDIGNNIDESNNKIQNNPLDSKIECDKKSTSENISEEDTLKENVSSPIVSLFPDDTSKEVGSDLRECDGLSNIKIVETKHIASETIITDINTNVSTPDIIKTEIKADESVNLQNNKIVEKSEVISDLSLPIEVLSKDVPNLESKEKSSVIDECLSNPEARESVNKQTSDTIVAVKTSDNTVTNKDYFKDKDINEYPGDMNIVCEKKTCEQNVNIVKDDLPDNKIDKTLNFCDDISTIDIEFVNEGIEISDIDEIEGEDDNIEINKEHGKLHILLILFYGIHNYCMS